MRVARFVPKKRVMLVTIGISKGHVGSFAGMARN